MRSPVPPPSSQHKLRTSPRPDDIPPSSSHGRPLAWSPDAPYPSSSASPSMITPSPLQHSSGSVFPSAISSYPYPATLHNRAPTSPPTSPPRQQSDNEQDEEQQTQSLIGGKGAGGNGYNKQTKQNNWPLHHQPQFNIREGDEPDGVDDGNGHSRYPPSRPRSPPLRAFSPGFSFSQFANGFSSLFSSSSSSSSFTCTNRHMLLLMSFIAVVGWTILLCDRLGIVLHPAISHPHLMGLEGAYSRSAQQMTGTTIVSEKIDSTTPSTPDIINPFAIDFLSPSLPLTYGKSSLPLAYLFPLPPHTSSLSYTEPRFYVTATPNHGAGLGHEFGEWVQGAWMSIVLGIHYVHTPFGIHARQWNDFLGFGVGETTRADLLATYTNVEVFQREMEDEMYSEKYTVEWMKEVIDRKRAEWKQQVLSAPQNTDTIVASSSSSSSAVTTSSPPILPTPTLFHLNMVHVSSSSLVCEPQVYASLRKKYCLARLHDPMAVDLYARDANPGPGIKPMITIAFHLRCGDGCWNPYRTTPFASTIHTALRLREVLKQVEPGRDVALHLFSQKPDNMTAEEYFKPLLAVLMGHHFTVHTHFHARSTVTFHHLVKSDILIGSQSSFSWVAFLLHYTVSLGPIENCFHSVPFTKDTGVFNEEIFVEQWKKSQSKKNRYDSVADCEKIKPENSTLYTGLKFPKHVHQKPTPSVVAAPVVAVKP